MTMEKTINIDEIIEDLYQGKVISEDIVISSKDKAFLFAKAREVEKEAQFYELYDANMSEAEAERLYNIASKLYALSSD